MKWGRALLDLLFPCCCPGCGKVTSEEAPWCEDCLRTFWEPRLLSRSHSRELEGCYTCCRYAGALRTCIIQLKYNGRRNRGRTFFMLLARFPWWDRLAACDLAVPVPLSAARKQSRGYNQCDLIFQPYLESIGKAYDPEFLVRLRDTRTQSELDREARLRNVRGAFHINRGRSAKERRILLLDDVYTTGSTMREAARELRRAGAASVTGLTIASGAV